MKLTRLQPATMIRHFFTGIGLMISLFISVPNCFPQVATTAVPFLLITPSTESNAMGEASVANFTDNPLAPINNPAHLGMLSQSQYVTVGYDRCGSWLPDLNLSDKITFTTFAINGGINLKKLNEDAPPLSVGIGYSRIYLDLGKFARTTVSPDITEYVNTWESSDQVTVGTCLDYGIKIAAGLTYKHVTSHLYGGMTNAVEDAKANLLDYGFLADVPVLDLLSRSTDISFQIAPQFMPFLNWRTGIAWNNEGQESMMYIDQGQGDPLPRNASVGIGLDMGIAYTKDALSWQPVSLKLTRESSEVLVGSSRQYKSGLGDIKFFDEVFLGNTNPKTDKKTGWEFNLGEIVFFRGGRFEEDPMNGNRHFHTSGLGIRSAGFVKLLQILDVPLSREGLSGYLLHHVDITYNYSEWIADEPGHPLSHTTFNAVNIAVFN